MVLIKRADKQNNRQAFENMLTFLMHSPGQHVQPLDDVYSFVRLKPESGQRYFSITCPTCSSELPLFADPSNGALGNPFSGRGGFRSPCYTCRKDVVALPPQIHSVLPRDRT